MRSSASLSSGVNSGPKSSASYIWRISISAFPRRGLGHRLTHSIASSLDFTRNIQKPAINSLVSVNGPSITVRLVPENSTRAPLELGCSPSPASSTPAFISSSLYFPISVSNFLSGRTPASVFLSALSRIMNRIVSLLLICGQARDLHHRPDFYGAHPRGWNARGNSHGLVEIFGIDQEVAAQLFTRLREGTVGHQPFAVADPDAGRCRGGVQRRRGQILPALLNLLRDLRGFAVALLPLGLAQDLLVKINQQHELHKSASMSESNDGRLNRHPARKYFYNRLCPLMPRPPWKHCIA